MKKTVLLIVLIATVLSGKTQGPVQSAQRNPNEPDFIRAERVAIEKTLALPVPVRLLEVQDSNLMSAQLVATADPQFLKFAFDTTTHKPLRTEIFTVTKLRESDMVPKIKAVCSSGDCYGIEMYNYALDIMTFGVVSLGQRKMVAGNYYRNFKPEIPIRLKELAVKIATESPEVQKALGYKPEGLEAKMAGTKTSLNHSRCERSNHLCVAPSFVQGEKVLWAIVDLADLSLVGVRWLNAGAENAREVTERKFQNANVTDCCCKVELPLEKQGWSLNYILTSSDGLRISNVRYKGNFVIDNAKIVDWHVSYSNTDGFGYSDAVGCPYFSNATVVAIEEPKVAEIVENGQVTGFVLEQVFATEGWPDPCSYNYGQRYEFYNDGRFRMSVGSFGRGCGNNATYRPVTRIVFASKQQNLYEWNRDTWQLWEKEQWQLQGNTTTYTPEGYRYKIELNGQSGFYIEPGQGQFSDGGRGDNAWFYATRRKLDFSEGEGDLATIGPCCNTDYRQGPEKFIEPAPEPIAGEDLVLWYVPQIKNDDTRGNEYCWAERVLEGGIYKVKSYPCFAGPMFVPYNLK